MNILPPSQIKNLPILEDILEELRLNVLEHLFHISEALDLYSLDTEALKKKLGLLGLSSISIGKFISLDISSSEYEFISPYFYKSYRRLNQHRGSKQSIDYILHSAGLMNTLVHSNTQFYAQDNIFIDNDKSFFDFNSVRDNQIPELGIPDGYIIIPYTTNNLQTLKNYLASNPILFNFIPAGYTFIFLSDYRTQFSSGVLNYDNLLDYNYLDQEVIENESGKPESDYEIDHLECADRFPYPDGDLFHNVYYGWEPFTRYYAEEIIGSGKDEKTIVHTLYYYNPFLWHDEGSQSFHVANLRYTDKDDLYNIPYEIEGVSVKEIKESNPVYKDVFDADVYISLISDGVDKYALDKFIEGYEAFLNNALPYPDLWVGDYLLPAFKGEERLSEYLDHVFGIKPVQSPSHSFASMFARGASLLDNYLEREGGIVSTHDTLIQHHKKGIISDRQRVDLFKFYFSNEYSLWMMSVSPSHLDYAKGVINTALDGVEGWYPELSGLVLSTIPSLLLDCIEDFSTAESLFNSVTVNSTYGHEEPPYGLIYEVIFAVKDGTGKIVLTNKGHYEAFRPAIMNHAHTQAIQANLGLVGRAEPASLKKGGYLGADYETVVYLNQYGGSLIKSGSSLVGRLLQEHTHVEGGGLIFSGTSLVDRPLIYSGIDEDAIIVNSGLSYSDRPLILDADEPDGIISDTISFDGTYETDPFDVEAETPQDPGGIYETDPFEVEEEGASIDLDVRFGDAVTIPDGYKVDSIKSTGAFVKASSYSYDGDYTLELTVEGDYLDTLQASEFTLGSNPNFNIFSVNSVTNVDTATTTGYYLTYRASQNPTTKASSISVVKLNQDGVFFKISVTYASASNANSVYNSIATRYNSLQLRYYDSTETQESYTFLVPESLWSFNNGTFSWAGLGTDYSQAWWYNKRSLYCRIHCVKDPDVLNLVLGIRWVPEHSQWEPQTFSANDYWWAGLMSEEDKQKVLDFGLNVIKTGYNWEGTIGAPEYRSDCTYEPIALYTGNGTGEVAVPSDFYCGYRNYTDGDMVTINNVTALATQILTWKLRITRIPTSLLAYRQDGTTAQAQKFNGIYRIPTIDSTFRSEADWNTLGWYFKWRYFTTTNNINIRDTYGTETSTVIAVFQTTDHPIGNPYLIGPSGYTDWQQIKFSDDGGTTIKTGWIHEGNSAVSFVLQEMATDVLVLS